MAAALAPARPCSTHSPMPGCGCDHASCYRPVRFSAIALVSLVRCRAAVGFEIAPRARHRCNLSQAHLFADPRDRGWQGRHGGMRCDRGFPACTQPRWCWATPISGFLCPARRWCLRPVIRVRPRLCVIDTHQLPRTSFFRARLPRFLALMASQVVELSGKQPGSGRNSGSLAAYFADHHPMPLSVADAAKPHSFLWKFSRRRNPVRLSAPRRAIGQSLDLIHFPIRPPVRRHHSERGKAARAPTFEACWPDGRSGCPCHSARPSGARNPGSVTLIGSPCGRSQRKHGTGPAGLLRRSSVDISARKQAEDDRIATEEPASRGRARRDRSHRLTGIGTRHLGIKLWFAGLPMHPGACSSS